ncbi:MAG: hypothetical protein [aquatic viral metagenome]
MSANSADVINIKESEVYRGHYLSLFIKRYDLYEFHNMYIQLMRKKYGGRKPEISCEPLTVYTQRAQTNGHLEGAGLDTVIKGRSYAEFLPLVTNEWIQPMLRLANDVQEEELLAMGSVGGCFHDIPNKKVGKLVQYQHEIESIQVEFNTLLFSKTDKLKQLLMGLYQYTFTIYQEALNAIRQDKRETLLYGTKRPEAGTGIRIGGYSTLGDLLQYGDKETLLRFIDDAQAVALAELRAFELFLQARDPTKAYVVEIISDAYRGSYGVRSDIDRSGTHIEDNRQYYGYESKTREVNVLTPASAFSNANINENTKNARRYVYRLVSELLHIELMPPDIISTQNYIRLVTATQRYETADNMGPVLVSRDLGFTLENGSTTPADLVYPSSIGIIYNDSSMVPRAIFVGNPSGAPTTQIIYLGYNIAIYDGYNIEYGMVLGDDAHVIFRTRADAERWDKDLGYLYTKTKGILTNDSGTCEYTFILGTVYKYCRDGSVAGFKIPKDMKSETTPKGGSTETGWVFNLEPTFQITRETPVEKIREFTSQWQLIKIVFLQRNKQEVEIALTDPTLYQKAYQVTGSTGDLLLGERGASNL